MNVTKFHPLTNIEIDDYYANTPNYGGCMCKDELPKQIQKKYYIINMANSNQEGSHWVLVYNSNPKYCLYFDAFGVYPPLEIMKFMKTSKKKMVMNDADIQYIRSVACGFFCCYIANELNAGRSILDVLFDDFSSNPALNDNILKKHLQMRKQGHSGKGIIDRITSFIKHPFRKDFSSNGRDILKQHGNKEISSIVVCRKPVLSFFKAFLNMLSLGKFSSKMKELDYSDIFHLFCVIKLKDNTVLQTQKNQVPELSTTIDIDSNTQTMPINVSNHLTLNEFINGGKNILKDAFWTYNKATNNCQFYVQALLNGSGLNSLQANKFVMQKASELVKTIPNLPSNILDKLINLATRADILLKGNGIKNKISSKHIRCRTKQRKRRSKGK